MNDVEREALATLDDRLASLTGAVRNARETIRTLLSDDSGRGFFVVRGLHTMEDVESHYTLYVLAKCEGNKTLAAQTLKVDPSTLHRKLARWSEEGSAAEGNGNFFPSGP